MLVSATNATSQTQTDSSTSHSPRPYATTSPNKWTAEYTQTFIDKVTPFRNALEQLFFDNLRLTSDTLEVGAGPEGGLTSLLPTRELQQSLFTITERMPTKHRWIKQIAAEDLPKRFGRTFSTIVAANVMDCILEGGMEVGRRALEGMKAVLKPDGEIKLFHYFGATGGFMLTAIRELSPQYIAIPFQSTTNYNDLITLDEACLILVDRSKIDLPCDPNNADSKSLRTIVGECYTNEERELLSRDPSLIYFRLLDHKKSELKVVKTLDTLIHKIGIDTFKTRYGARIVKPTELLIERIQALASLCSMTSEVEFRLASANALQKGGGKVWFNAVTDESPDPNIQHLLYTFITLVPDQALHGTISFKN